MSVGAAQVEPGKHPVHLHVMGVRAQDRILAACKVSGA